MKKRIFFGTVLFLAIVGNAIAQEVPNFSNYAGMSSSAENATKSATSHVNLFTGLPEVSVPIYSYSGNNMSVNVSVDYNGGGIRVAEGASSVGLGWYLNTGGSITRVVRGMPDDIPTYGYLYASTIPTDYRSDGNKYYFDSLDSQQDIFYFSVPGHSGKFFFSKTGEVITVPTSKIKIIPSFYTSGPSNQKLNSFRIITEDGVKYDFNFQESTVLGNNPSFPSGYKNVSYHSAWLVGQIIAPFNTDTIEYYYTGSFQHYGYANPQITYVKNSDGTRKTPYVSPGSTAYYPQRIDSIKFPNKSTVHFIYSPKIKYNDDDFALVKVKVKDSVFRFGYVFEYQTSVDIYNGKGYAQSIPSRLLLYKITPYTLKEKQYPFEFIYHGPLFMPQDENDTIQNKIDYWGFYNGAVNDTMRIPKVNSYTWGADRTPNTNALANSLFSVKLPTGGIIGYTYELNDHYPYIKAENNFTIQANTNGQNNISLSQIFNEKHQFSFILSNDILREGSAPISGTGSLICNIRSSDGLTLYATKSISLYDLFYLGLQKWTLNLPNGSYRFDTELSSGSTVPSNFPIKILWENRTTDTTKNYVTAGGIRIKRISRIVNFTTGSSVEEFKYVTEDGKSSGFFGDIPKYDFPYREVVINGGTTNVDYTAVSSEPIADLHSIKNNIVGYSRVEVYNSNYSNQKLGKTVYEFTDLRDVNANLYSSSFPYAPYDFREWALGLPKKVSIYDSTNLLLKKTVNTYQLDTIEYNSSNTKSLKLGHNITKYYGDPNISSTPRTKLFIADEYYLKGGRIDLTSIKDTIYHSNGTINTSIQTFEYDTNYNVVKVISNYNKASGLNLEKRIYYPYNYSIGGTVGLLKDSSILSAVIATEEWITGDANPRILSGTITRFKQLASGYIRPDSIFALETNKPLLVSQLGLFDGSKLNRNYTYFKAQTAFPEYDVRGNLLQSNTVQGGISNAAIMDYSNLLPVANVSNAVVSDVAYTSFESDGSGNWIIGSTTRDKTDALSGKQSFNLTNGNITKTGLNTSQHYLVTIWVKTGASVIINGNALSNSLAQQNNWNLYHVALSNITSITVSGSGLIDELRLHPKRSNMVTNTYEPMIGITSTVDANNNVIYKEYDNLNRLYLIRDKDKNIIEKYEYTDSVMLVDSVPHWEGYAVICENGEFDSVYVDVNVFSDSVGMDKVVYIMTDYCNCSVVTPPDYKMVNDVCEQAVKIITSSTWMKVWDSNCSCYVWKWRCIYYYQWSDNSTSQTYITYTDDGCYIDL